MSKEKAESIMIQFQIDDKGFHGPIQLLFQTIGKSFSSFAIAMAAALECFYSCPDSSIRGICVSALSNLIHENEQVFRDKDQLAAVWNLFFLLSSYPENAKYFHDRVIVVKASIQNCQNRTV